MIDKRDIDLFHKAKKDHWIIEILTMLASICLMVLVLLEAKNIHNYTVILAITSFFFMLSAQGGRWVSSSRYDLIKAMERMINSDAEALKFIADSNNKKNQKQSNTIY